MAQDIVELTPIEPTLEGIAEALRSQRRMLHTLVQTMNRLPSDLDEMRTIVNLAYDAASTARAIATRLERGVEGHPREYAGTETPTNGSDHKHDTDPFPPPAKDA